MSKFRTTIPVDIERITKALPARSFVNEVTFDGENVIVQWENDDYSTAFTYAVEWSDLAELPAGVTKGQRKAISPTAPVRRTGAIAPARPRVSGQQTPLPATEGTKGTKDAPVTATANLTPKPNVSPKQKSPK